MPDALRAVAPILIAVALVAQRSEAENASQSPGDPVLDPPTLHCLGAYWIVRGDDNRNAKVETEYRKAGTKEWQAALPLFRVEKRAHKAQKFTGKKDGPEVWESKLDVPADAWLFAGSVVMLAPDTEYEIRLKLSDPDGGGVEKVLKARTIAEPATAAGAPQHHVVPGGGGGSGTKDDPYRGLDAAQAAAKPGDIFLVHAGVYEGQFAVRRYGEPGRPIVWRGAGDGEAILDGKGGAAKRVNRAIEAMGSHDVWFEKLTIRNADHGVAVHNSTRVVVRRCHIHSVDYGITCTLSDRDSAAGIFISDNTIEGPCTWPRTKGIENPRGIQITGTGHVVCYNRVRGFADAIDTYQNSPRCVSIDFHNNDVSELTDDGIEMDYSERNTRCFFNRLTNVSQGISVQPVYGGPVYVFRNVMYNVEVEPFKMHNSPSGTLMFHNTIVKTGHPLILQTPEKVRNCVYRNNLFIGTGPRAYHCDPPMVDCDFDYDGFGGGPWEIFLKWNNVRYATIDEVREKCPAYKHAVVVDPATAFASGLRIPDDVKRQYDRIVADFRLKEGCAAIDAGQVLPNFSDGFAGKAPDLGAYELGAPAPRYGPRPEK